MDLRRFLFEKKLPVKKFAEDMEISISLVYHLLNHQRMPSRNLASKIEKYTEGAVTKEELLFPGEAPPKRWALSEEDIQNRLRDHDERLAKLERFIAAEKQTTH